MKTIIVASTNKGKIKEFRKFFENKGILVKSLLDLYNIDVEETGETFIENALIKAHAIAKLSGEAVIADDSGLEVKALDNKPGIYSARYAGLQKNDDDNMDKLLDDLKNVSNREARFVSALALVKPNGEEIVTEGYLNGEILRERKGNGGFGYDPIFYIPDLDKTMAEITIEEKNKVSHRANAFRNLEKLLEI